MRISYLLQGVRFEWNDVKAQKNLQKHGITFEEAAEVFFDPFSWVDDASSSQEHRDLVIGYSFSRQLLLVVYTERKDWTRIISARRATRKEGKLYGQSGNRP